MTDRPTTPHGDHGAPRPDGGDDALERLAVDALSLGITGITSPGDDATDDLSAAVTSTAFGDRPAGRSLLAPDAPAHPVDAHREVATDLDALVRSLAANDLTRSTWLDETVGDVLAHLAGQLERGADLLDTVLAGRPAPDRPDGYDHWTSTVAAQQRLAGAPAGVVADALAQVNERIGSALAGAHGTDRLGSPDDLSSPATAALVRTFEMWMHADDVRLALGRPLVPPSPGTVLALCRLAAALVPVGMAVTGNARPGRTVRLVLVGAGGGTWRCPGEPGQVAGDDDDAVVVADAVQFCRLFHRQVPADAVTLAVEGDPDVARAVLVGAQAFAERT